MTKSSVIIFLVLVILKVQAQSYLINFAGTGDATIVNTVKVYNLTSGNSVTLNGADILHLTALVGIGKLEKNDLYMQLYPNPMEGIALLTFSAPVNGDASICIVDLSGKTVYQVNKLLSPGTHSFRVTDVGQGVYLLKVTGKNYNYSTKLLSLNNLYANTSIEYVSSVKNTAENQLKSTSAIVDMPYKDGERLLFKSTSGKYTTIATDLPSSSRTITFNFVACTDADNNNYSTVTIDTMVWMAENLKTTKFNDGTSIPEVTANSDWSALKTPGYCWYKNDIVNKNTYGALYNWFSVNTAILAPTGWHVPSDAEWTTLTTFLGGVNVAGGKLKETGTDHWKIPNTGATNESGFSALPGGYRSNSEIFVGLGDYYGGWWSASALENSTLLAWLRDLDHGYASVFRDYDIKSNGFSIRCVKD